MVLLLIFELEIGIKTFRSCCNKNKKELYNIRKYLPDYWKKLIELQSKIERPMKKFRTDAKFGDLGNIINLENYLKESENCEQNKN